MKLHISKWVESTFPDGKTIKAGLAIQEDKEFVERTGFFIEEDEIRKTISGNFPLAMAISKGEYGNEDNIVIVKKSFWDKLNDEERKAIIAHELIHIFLNHTWKIKEEFWNNEMEAIMFMKEHDKEKLEGLKTALEKIKITN